jgi:iron(II)-dependent oxidoreductase
LQEGETTLFTIFKNLLLVLLTISFLGLEIIAMALQPAWGSMEPAPPAVEVHLQGIASFAKPSPMVSIQEGWFLMGTNREDLNRHSFETHYDNTEFPQRRIWLDAYQIDQYEVSLGEFLQFLHSSPRQVSPELRNLIWHLISVHFIPDQALAPWPALYVTWEEAQAFCLNQGKRLPSEAEWEKAARGTTGKIFPWGSQDPSDKIAVFGAYHVHEIPLVANVDSFPEGQSEWGIYHLSGNIAEWVHDWFGSDYYPIMPERNPPGPRSARYKSVRGGSWKSLPVMLRGATRGGALPEERSPNIGFRCAKTTTQS